MNCKGNELAILKVPKGVPGHEHTGKIVFITTLIDGNYWKYEGTLCTPEGVPYVKINDNCLRPLKNPGDDEVDETLTWKCGKPSVVDVEAIKKFKQKQKEKISAGQN